MARAAAAASSASPTAPSSSDALRRIMRHLRDPAPRATRQHTGKTVGAPAIPAAPGGSLDPQRRDRLADEVAPLVADAGLVRRRRLGHGQARATEHPEGELDQGVEGAVFQVTAVDQVADEALDEPVGVVALAVAPAAPAQRGRA